MDLPTTTEAVEATRTLGGVAGLIALAKVASGGILRGWEHLRAERRARAEAALVEERAELVTATSLAEAVRDLQTRVRALETELAAERAARARAEAALAQERTGRHEALARATQATERLADVEREADRRIAEALSAVARSAEERARWERIAREQAAAYQELVHAIGSGHSSAPPADRIDELDTIPPPR